MKNIHLQPTSQLSRLVKIYNEADKKSFELKLDIEVNDNFKEYQNIYITSDEEISGLENNIWVYNNGRVWLWENTMALVSNNKPRKIILATDQDLDGVQSIDDEFLEWFVKNPSCEFVKLDSTCKCVECGSSVKSSCDYAYKCKPQIFYKIIIPKEEPKQEIVGYRLKPSINRMMVDGILKNAMPVWNDEDKSVYFIRGHVAGSLVAKMKELQVLDLWFIPIYEDEEIKSDWVKEHHLDYYYKEGIMSKSKQKN